MDNKQYFERLLEVLTYCESLKKTDYYPLKNGKAFGMTRLELIELADSLNRNNYVKMLVDSKRIILGQLTLEGHEKLEQLREKLWNRRWYVRTWRWICDIWWIHVPVLIATIHYFLELLNSLFKFLHLFFS